MTSRDRKENWKKFFDEKVTRDIPKNFYGKMNRSSLYKLEKIQEFLISEKKFFKHLQKDKNDLHSTILNQVQHRLYS